METVASVATATAEAAIAATNAKVTTTETAIAGIRAVEATPVTARLDEWSPSKTTSKATTRKAELRQTAMARS